jgi:hypothetical protein
MSKILQQEGINKSYMFTKYCDKYGSFPVQEMWKLKKKLWPKRGHSVPVAKINHRGQLVASSNDLKCALLKEYTKRLREGKLGMTP